MEKLAKINQIPLKIFLFLIINDLQDTCAQLLMKKGLRHGDITNPHFYLFLIGLVIYISNFFLWMFILSKIDLSVALPLASIGYILVPFAAIFFLHEFVTPLRWLGLVFIILGIYFVSQSKSSGDKS